MARAVAVVEDDVLLGHLLGYEAAQVLEIGRASCRERV